MYYKACTKYSPVLLCTTKLAQSTSQYYCVLQRLPKVLRSISLYRKACTQYFPVLICTTKLAHSISQYYFVLQSLHKALPCTTVYYKGCQKYFPILLCTAKLAQRISQHYFVLQRLHKVFPSTTLYYEACAKHFPVQLCTTNLAQSTSQYYFVIQSWHKESFSYLFEYVLMGSYLFYIPPKHFDSSGISYFVGFIFLSACLAFNAFFQQRFRLYSWVSAVLALAFISRCHFSLIPSTITGPGGTFEPLQLTAPCTPLWGQPRPGGNLCTAIHYTFKCPTCHMWSINFSCCHLTKIYTRF